MPLLKSVISFHYPSSLGRSPMRTHRKFFHRVSNIKKLPELWGLKKLSQSGTCWSSSTVVRSWNRWGLSENQAFNALAWNGTNVSIRAVLRFTSNTSSGRCICPYPKRFYAWRCQVCPLAFSALNCRSKDSRGVATREARWGEVFNCSPTVCHDSID
jgi:hypothetical protein